MARVRSAPRNAGRHTGQQWSEGRQYEFDGIRSLALGPWTDLVQEPIVEAWQSSILSTGPMWVKRGKLSPFVVSGQMGSQAYTDTVLGGGSVTLLGEDYRFVFATDATSGNLELHVYNSAGTKTTADTGDTSNGGLVMWAMIGKRMYFIQQGVAVMYIYDIDSGGTTFSTATTHASETKLTTNDECWFIYVLDNNLCIICQDADQVPTIYWYADSNVSSTGQPGGFYSAASQPGAGNFLVKAEYGDVTGVGFFDDTIYVNCEYGAIRMAPTGTLPAFRFNEDTYITGCPVLNGTHGGTAGVFYIGRDGFGRLVRGGQPEVVGQQPPRWNPFSTTLYVQYSSVVDAWFVWDTTQGDVAGECFVLDGTTAQWSSRMTDSMFGSAKMILSTFYSSTLFGGATGADIIEPAGGTNIFRLDPAWIDSGGTRRSDIETPNIPFGDDVRILWIDVHYTNVDLNVIDINSLTWTTIRGGTETDVVATQVEANDYYQRFAVNSISRLGRVKIDFTARGNVNELSGISKIEIYLKPGSAIKEARLRV